MITNEVWVYVVWVNGKIRDEYMKEENAERHADMARRLGNEAHVEKVVRVK